MVGLAQHRLDMLTPPLTITKAMRCTRWGAEGVLLAGASCHHAPKKDAMKVDAALKDCGSWPPA